MTQSFGRAGRFGVAVAACALIGSMAVADLAEPHLDIVPRTPEETSRIDAIVRPTTQFDRAERFEEMSAGAATERVRATTGAFSLPSANISFEGQLNFHVGDGLFHKDWVMAPSSTTSSDGLGPLYNARSCQGCHIKDGRGHPPEGPEDDAVSMFLRVSIPGGHDDAVAEIEDYIASRAEPTYGTQLQDHAILGQPPEYRLDISYEEIAVPLAGGEVASLRRPSYRAADLGYGPLHPDAMLSPRVAPQMIGLGLLEAVPAADVLALADPDDADGDGISGRPNLVWSVEFEQPMLGRFGLKAGNPTIREQAASAFVGDIGVSNPLFPAGAGECTDLQADCIAAIHGDLDDRGVEVDAEGLDLVTFYSRNLAVPARRDVDDPQVLRGKEIFYATGCTSCHAPKFVTHRLADRPEQSFQLIWPYTDLLLHDMGPGLADGRPEARATGVEWRTAPLWGLGLTGQVSGHTYFLHDGRARSVLEAILWHGGEARTQRDAVVALPPEDRTALVRFLDSL